MRSIVRYLGLVSLLSTTSLYALSYPASTPAGETTGGTYRLFFDNIFSSETLCDGANMVVGGFDSIGTPICVMPVSTGLYVTGQTLGDTLRFDGSSWVRNNLIYNDGTAVGIANQTPGYPLDVGGTANFLGIRLPTGAASGYVLTSDPSGVARWSDAPNISLSGITGGSEYVVPKFGAGGSGLILSSLYDNGVTVGINTLVPSALYKLDIVGGDVRINGVRFGLGGGNLSSNVAIGMSAFAANVTSPNNVVIGNLAGSTLNAGAGGNILIGNAVNTTTATSSNELNIGNWIFGDNGNIGIGTGVGITTRLLVDGQIQITGGSPAAGMYLQSDASGIGSWTGVTATAVTASGITGGTEYYLTKFGAGGNGLFASILYETGGKLGLNTINPSVEFDVNGTIRVRSGGTLGYILTSDANGVASWQAPGVTMNTWNVIGNAGTTAGTHFVGTTDAQDLVFKTNSVEYARILTTGNVGIGTAVPGQKLTVSGGTLQLINGNQANGRMLISDANGVASWTGVITATNLNLAGAVTGSTIYYNSGSWRIGTGMYNDGNRVGIGTATPGSALEINGQVKITGGTPGLNKVLTSDASGLASWTNALTSLSGSFWSLSGTTAGANDYIGTNNAQDVRFYSNGTQKMVLDTSGNLGINTTAPGQKLTVSGGTLQLINGTQANGRFLVSDANGVSSWTGIVAASSLNFAGSVTGSTLFFQSGAWNVGTGLYNAGGYIGIGTATPGSALEINGQVKITGGTPGLNKVLTSDASGLASWTNALTSLSGSFWSLSGTTAGANDYIGTNNAQNLRFYSSGSQKVVLDTNGNVGINTTAPGEKLTVSGGTLQLINGTQANGRMLISDANGVSSWTGVITATNLNLAGAVTGSTIYYNSGSWRIGTGMYNDGNRVGIGTATPGTTLEVAGQVKITGGTPGLNKVLTSDASGLASWTNALTSLSGSFWSLSGTTAGANDYIGTNNAQDVRFYSNGTQKMVLDTNGNVGIGIASPGTNKLYVNGDTYISGALSVLGKLYVDNIVSRTVTNVTVSGSILPDSATPIAYRDLGSNAQRWNNLYLSGQVSIGGGSPGLGKFLVSDATGLASWTGVITATNLNLAGAVTGSTIFYNSGAWRVGTGMFNNGTNVGIGTANPGAALEVAGQVKITGGVPGTGKMLISDSTGLASWTGVITATNLNLAGAVTGSTVFYNSGAWRVGTGMFNNGTRVGIGTANPGSALEVNGQVKITGGVPGAGKVLTSDASGLAYWTGAITATSLSIPGAVSGATLYYTGGAWLAGTGLFNNGVNIGIGVVNPNSKLTIDSGLSGTSGLRFTQINSSSNVVGTNVIGLGIDGSGYVVPISNGDVIVYDGITSYTPSPNPDNPNREISYDFNQYFRIPAKQSFVVTDGLSPGLNAPYIGENATYSVCEWTGTVGTGMATCPTGDFPGSPYNSFTMSARSDANYGYQIGLAYRGDIQLMARSGKFRDGSDAGTDIDFDDYGSGLYLGTTATPAPWYKVLTVPTNHVEWFYIDTGYTGQWNPTGYAGNVGIGTNDPISRFEIWYHNNGTSLMHFRGTNNIGMGSGSVRTALTGNANSGFGHETLNALTNGYSNTALGFKSMFRTTGGYNNIAAGQESLYNNNNGSFNTALGYQAVYTNTTGTGNIGIGPSTVYFNGVGSNNIGIGYYALRGITGSSTSNNIALGLNSLSGTTGNNNVAVGVYAGDELRGTTTNNILIGYDAQASSPTGSNQLSIGNWIYGSGGTIGIGTGALGTAARLKVAGQIEITGGSPGAGKVLTSDANGLATWQASGGGGGTAGWSFSGDTIGANDYIGTNNAQGLKFSTNGVQRMLLDTSGNLGVGTSTGTAKLEVAGQVKITGGTPGAGQVLTSDANGLATWEPATGGGWGLSGNAGTTAGTNYIGTSDAVDFTIGTSGTEKMRVESGGDVGIGTTNPGSKLDVNGTVKLGTNGTQFNAVIRATITRDIANTNAGICRNEDFTVTNALTTGSVFVSPSANHEDRFIISAARVRAAGIVEVEFCNVSAAAINPTSKDYYITVFQ